MSFSDERAAIESRFSNNWSFASTVPAAYDNVPFTPPKLGGDFVTCSVVSGRGLQASIGDDPMFRYVGVIQNLIFCSKDKGSQQARFYADAITPIWRRQKFALGFSGIITSWTPSFVPIGVKDGRYQALLSTPYYRDEFMTGVLQNLPGNVPPIGAFKQYVPTGLINGSNQSFLLPSTPLSVLNMFLFWKRSLQIAPADFTLSGSAITTNFIPQPGDSLVAYY